MKPVTPSAWSLALMPPPADRPRVLRMVRFIVRSTCTHSARHHKLYSKDDDMQTKRCEHKAKSSEQPAFPSASFDHCCQGQQ